MLAHCQRLLRFCAVLQLLQHPSHELGRTSLIVLERVGHWVHECGWGEHI